MPPRIDFDETMPGGCACEVGGRELKLGATQIGPLGALVSMAILTLLARRRRRSVPFRGL
jgi:hypothetical protein